MFHRNLLNKEVPSVTTKSIVLHDGSPLNVEARFCLTSDPSIPLQQFDNLCLYALVLEEEEAVKIVANLNDPTLRQKMLDQLYNKNFLNLRSSRRALFYPLSELYRQEDKLISHHNLQEYYNSFTIQYDFSKNTKKPTDPSFSPRRAMENINTPKLHLVCLVDNNPQKIIKHSLFGNLSHDLLLTEGVDSEGKKILDIPSTRKSFFVDDIKYPRINLTPYNGPAHYHSESNPGPPGYRDRIISASSSRRGYVGWMAGHPRGKMGPKLRVAESRNEKIQVMVNFNNLIKANPELESNQKIFNSTGDSLKSMSRVFQNTSDSQKAKQKQKRLSSLSVLRKDQSILEKYSDQTGYTRVIQDSEDPSKISYNSHYGCLLGVNVLRALKCKSVFGNYIDFHEQKGNQDILFSIIKRAKILKLSVVRRRMTKEYTGRNSQGGKTRERFSRSRKDTKLITTRDKKRTNNSLESARNALAAVHQVSVSHLGLDASLTSPYYVRMLNINDYDLFHNVRVGNYTYFLEIDFKDGAISYLKSLIKRMTVASMRLKKYQTIGSRPAKYDETGKHKQGNYDFLRARTVAPFNQSSSYDQLIDQSALLYNEVFKFLTGKNLTQQDINSIRSCLSPKRLNLAFLESFISQMSLLNLKIKDLLSKNSNIVQSAFYGKPRRNNIESFASPDRPGTFKFSVKTNIDIDASGKNYVNTDYNISSANSKSNLHINDIGDFLAKTYIDRSFREPTRFVKLNTLPYSTENNKTYATSFRNADSVFAKEISKDNKITNSGNIEEMMKREEFYSANHSTQSNFETKILALKQPGAREAGILNKPESFFPGFLQNKSNSFVITVSGIADNNLKSFQQISKLKELILGARPDASDDLIKTLHEDLVEIDDDKELDKIIDQKYQSLVLIKDKLGGLYSRFNRSLNLKKNLIKSQKKQTFKNRYLNGSSTTPSAYSTAMEERSVFSMEKACLYSIVPGVGKIKINPESIIRSSGNNTGRNQYMFIKVEHVNKDFKLPLINNGFLVEI